MSNKCRKEVAGTEGKGANINKKEMKEKQTVVGDESEVEMKVR